MSVAHLHLLVNHFPVVGSVLGVLLLAVAMVRGSKELERTALAAFALLGVAAIVVYLTGEPAEESLERAVGIPEALVSRHEAVALAATVAMGVLGAMSLGALLGFRKRDIPRWVPTVVLVASVATASIMGYTANLGGQIRHTEIRGGDVATDAVAQPIGTQRDRD